MGCQQSNQKKDPKWSSRVLSPHHHPEIQNGHSQSKKANLMMDAQASEKIREILQQYQNKEAEINSIEKGEPLTIFYIKKSHLESINRRIDEQEKKVVTLENGGNSTTSSRCNSVKSVLLKFGDKKLNKEDHEILASSNKLEIAQAELEMSHQEKALVENEVRNLHSTLLSLREAYRQQDDLLEKLSVSDETPEESRLQTELADVETQRMKISEIYESWTEGRSQVAESCRQFSTALNKWRKLPHTGDSANHLEEYDVAEEIRDYLVNAIQCLTNAKFYVRVELPYCSPAEVSVLEKALTYLFIDLRSAERRQHAELCYTAIHKRSVALFAWVDKTIEFVIEPDLKSLTKIINEKANRLKLIRTEEISRKYPGIQASNRIYNDDQVTLRLADMDGQSTFSSLDPETDKIFNELEFDQLAPLPSIQEISMASKTADEYIETVKTELRQDFVKTRQHVQNVIEANLDEVVAYRRNTLTRKLMLIDSIR